jgi:hypothetical protein
MLGASHHRGASGRAAHHRLNRFGQPLLNRALHAILMVHFARDTRPGPRIAFQTAKHLRRWSKIRGESV